MRRPPSSSRSPRAAAWDTSIVRSPAELSKAAAILIERYGQALVEHYVTGPELTVGILGNATLPVCEIRPLREFYDYKAKYEVDDTQYIFDLDLPDELIRRVESLSLAAHRALGCRVLSRGGLDGGRRHT